jgi:hypothetical protein
VNLGIPRKLLMSHVEEAHQEESSLYHFNPYRGNLLHVYDPSLGSEHRRLAMPGGLAGNELCKHHDHEFSLKTIANDMERNRSI